MKTGLVVEGGGMKCAYSAGILDRFLDDGITFDECIGVSAGAANLVSYAAGQRGRNLRFYVGHAQDPRYMGMRHFLTKGSFFNYPYIFGELSGSSGADPLDYAALLENPAAVYLTATDAVTGDARYFEKSEMAQDDYRILMAGGSIPALCPPVEIAGRMYYDGGLADPVPLQKAFDDGCDKVVVLLENPRTFVRQQQKMAFAYHFLLRKYPKMIEMIDNRHLRYQETLSRVYEQEREGRVFIFAPPENTGVSTTTKDPDLLQKLYRIGVADYDAQREMLIAYLEE